MAQQNSTCPIAIVELKVDIVNSVSIFHNPNYLFRIQREIGKENEWISSSRSPIHHHREGVSRSANQRAAHNKFKDMEKLGQLIQTKKNITNVRL